VKDLLFGGNDLGGYESMVVSQVLSKFLSRLAAVRLLDLSNNDLQDYDIELLCGGLGKNRTVETVLLSGAWLSRRCTPQQILVTRFAASHARTTVRSERKLDHCLTL
jgi:hypothetical protein